MKFYFIFFTPNKFFLNNIWKFLNKNSNFRKIMGNIKIKKKCLCNFLKALICTHILHIISYFVNLPAQEQLMLM